MIKTKLMNNKKGDVTDILTFLIMIFILAIAFIIVIFANSQISTVISTTVLNDTNVSSDILDHLDRMNTSTVQNGYVAIFAFLIIGMMASSFLIRIHPVFLFLYIIFLAVTIFVGVPLANSYQMVIENETLAVIASQQTAMNWILEHILVILLGVGALSMIITFAKLAGGSRNPIAGEL